MDVTETEIYISTVGKKKLTNHKSSLSSIDPFLKPSQTSNLSIDTICLRPNPPGTWQTEPIWKKDKERKEKDYKISLFAINFKSFNSYWSLLRESRETFIFITIFKQIAAVTCQFARKRVISLSHHELNSTDTTLRLVRIDLLRVQKT